MVREQNGNNDGDNESDEGNEQVRGRPTVWERVSQAAIWVRRIQNIGDLLNAVCKICGFDVGKIAEHYGPATDFLSSLLEVIHAVPTSSWSGMAVTVVVHTILWRWYTRQ